MLAKVVEAIEGLKLAFPDAAIETHEDGAGGARVIVHPVTLGAGFAPQTTWMGGHITAQCPYADIYPIFIGSDVHRTSGRQFEAPVTAGHNFNGRPALQISRRTNRLEPTLQTAAIKFQKVLHWFNSQA